jgi:uncharacterized protein YceK
MKNYLLFLVSSLAIVMSGCSSAPKTISRTTVNPGSYTYGQEPAKTKLADKGGIYDKHAKALQEMRLAHERDLVAIEFEAERARVAKEKGITNLPPRSAVSPGAPGPSSANQWAPPGSPPRYVVRTVYVGQPSFLGNSGNSSGYPVIYGPPQQYTPPPVTLTPSGGGGHRRVIVVRNPNCR